MSLGAIERRSSLLMGGLLTGVPLLMGGTVVRGSVLMGGTVTGVPLLIGGTVTGVPLLMGGTVVGFRVDSCIIHWWVGWANVYSTQSRNVSIRGGIDRGAVFIHC